MRNFCYLSLFLKFIILESIVAKNSKYRVYEKAQMLYSSAKISVGINEDRKFEHFLIPTSKKIEIKKMKTCGNEMFPHGIYIDSVNAKPMVFCESHKCFNPQQIYCQKSILPSQCKLDNQWIAGIHQNYNHKSENTVTATVDCCQYKGISNGKFLKHFNLSFNESFIHEIAVKEGRLIRFSYVNNLKVEKSINNLTLLKLDVYEMACPIEPWQLETFDSFVKKDLLGPPPKYKDILVYDNNALDRNSSTMNIPSKDIWNPYLGCTNRFVLNDFGLKVYENPAQIENSCGIFGFPHGFFIDMITSIPRMYCKTWPSCFQDPNKIICVRDIGTMRCKNENEWIAGFIPNKGQIEIECCHYEDIHSATFIRNFTLDILDIFTHQIYRKNDFKLFGFTYVNGLTKENKGEHIYNASLYRMKCPRINNDEFIALLNGP